MHVEIRIHHHGDPTPLFPELVGKVKMCGDLTHFGILEAGMTSGKTSVMLSVALTDGSYVGVETSNDMLQTLAAAARGADEAFAHKGKEQG